MNPVKILATDEYVRAVRGGIGAAKTAGNYARASMPPSRRRRRDTPRCCGWDGVEHRYLEEVGTMNIMVRLGDTVVTPALNGSILPGSRAIRC